MNKQQFIYEISRLENALNKYYTKEQLEIFYEFFSKYSNIEFRKAINNILTKHIYNNLPTIAEINNSLNLKDEEMENIIIAKTYQIKNVIDKLARNTQLMYICDDKLIHKVIDILGGLKKIGQMNEVDYENRIYFQIKEILKSIKYQSDYFPIFAGNRNSDTIVFIGDVDKIRENLKIEYKNNNIEEDILNKIIKNLDIYKSIELKN